MTLRVVDDGTFRDIEIGEDEIFLLPGELDFMYIFFFYSLY